MRISSSTSLPEPNPDEKNRGETASYGLKFAVIEVPERGFVIELNEPDNSPSTFREYLDKHGKGLHIDRCARGV